MECPSLSKSVTGFLPARLGCRAFNAINALIPKVIEGICFASSNGQQYNGWNWNIFKPQVSQIKVNHEVTTFAASWHKNNTSQPPAPRSHFDFAEIFQLTPIPLGRLWPWWTWQDGKPKSSENGLLNGMVFTEKSTRWSMCFSEHFPKPMHWAAQKQKSNMPRRVLVKTPK